MKHILVLIFFSSLTLYKAELIRIKRGFLGGIHGFPVGGYPPSVGGGYPPSVGGGYPVFVEQPQQDVVSAPVNGIVEDPSSDSISVESAAARSNIGFGFRRYPPIVDSDSVSIESASSPGIGVGVGGGVGGGAITGGSPGSLLESYVPSILGGIQSRQRYW